MKITKIIIKNLFGLKAFDSDGQSMELIGKNGTGKSSFIDEFRYAFSNKSGRDYIVRKGADEGEILIETDTGLRINRKSRTNGADYRSIKENGKDVQRPEAFLRELYTELQFNPIEFIGMSKSEQNRIILDMIDFKWDLNWIKDQFGELVPDVNYEQNILCVLHDIQADEGYYFQKRQDINREARNKQAFIEEIGQELPPGYDANKWINVDLGDLYKKVQRIRSKNAEIEKAKQLVENRDNKVRGFQADLEIEISSIDKAASMSRENLTEDIRKAEERLREYKKDLEGIEEEKIKDKKLAQKGYEANVAEFEGEVKQFEDLAKEALTPFDDLQKEADTADKMKAYVNEYNRMVSMQGDVGVLREDSEALTGKIEHARELPGEILEKSSVPIEGLTIKDGIPLINGLPVSNLSDGEKMALCVDVATQNPNALQMILLDGTEKLSAQNRKKLYESLRSKGIRFISTRTTEDSELMVGEL